MWVLLAGNGNHENRRSLLAITNIDCSATTMANMILSKDLLAFTMIPSSVTGLSSQVMKVKIQLSDSDMKMINVGKKTSNIGMNNLETSCVYALWFKVILHISSWHQKNEHTC